MRIPCPYCGERSSGEFICRGEAAGSPRAADGDAGDRLYLRQNPAGVAHELWYHVHGCRQWLILARDTRTHDIISARLAAERPS